MKKQRQLLSKMSVILTIASLMIILPTCNCVTNRLRTKQPTLGNSPSAKEGLIDQPKLHIVSLQHSLPTQEAMVHKLNLLREHQAALMQRESFSFLEMSNGAYTSSLRQANIFAQQQALELHNHDNSYFTGKLRVGETDFQVIFDTGSSALFVNSDYCASCMTNHAYYTETSTLEETNYDITVQFGSGTVTGILSKDNIVVADVPIKMGNFIQITKETGSIFENSHFDGIVGLMRTSLSDRLPTLLEQIRQQNILEDQNILGFYLERQKEGSELSVGAIDRSKFDGEIVYHKPIFAMNFWALSCTQIRVGDVNTNLCSEANPCQLILDSGTSFFTGPPDSVTQLLQTINQDNQGCKSLYDLPVISFLVDGTDYNVYPNEYVVTVSDKGPDPFFYHSDIETITECVMSFYGLGFSAEQSGSESTNTWVLGDVFMEKFYTIFDKSQDRIGLAKSKKYGQLSHD